MIEAIELAGRCGASIEREWSSQARTTFKSKKALQAFYEAAVQRGREIVYEELRAAIEHGPENTTGLLGIPL